MKISFVPEAAKDLDDAVEWYESERKGLEYYAPKSPFLTKIFGA